MRRLRDPRRLAIVLVTLAAIVLSRVLFSVPLPHVQLPAEVIPGLPALSLRGLGELRLTNTMVAVLLADATLLAVVLAVRRRLELVPGGLQNVLEAVVEWWHNQAVQMIGARHARTWFPLVVTVFLLILTANWYELIPGYDTVGVLVQHEASHGDAAVAHTTWRVRWLGEPGRSVGVVTQRDEAGHGEDPEHTTLTSASGWVFVPFLRAAATDLNFTLAIALVCFIAIEIVGFRAGGWRYIRKFIHIDFSRGLFMGIIGVLVGLFELLSEFIRIISFTFRLFGNLFAGQMLLFVVPFLVPLMALPVYALELFVGLVQAFVFSILTLAFMAVALATEDSHS